MNQGFVYNIVNAQNGKMYIGKTLRTIPIRWRQHVHDANGGSDVPLHRSIRKHGIESFQIEEMASVETKDIKITNRLLNNLEINLIREYGTFVDKGYNATLGGEGMDKGTRLKLTEEQRKKRAERIRSVPAMISGLGMLGKKHKAETIAKFRALNSNRSPEHNLRISKAKKGKPTWASMHPDIGTKAAIAAVEGKPRSEAFCKKISDSRRGRFKGPDNSYFGRKHSEEVRAKMRGHRPSIAGENHPLFGKHHTEETVAKISAAQKARDLRGERNPNFGRVVPAEQIARVVATRKTNAEKRRIAN